MTEINERVMQQIDRMTEREDRAAEDLRWAEADSFCLCGNEKNPRAETCAECSPFGRFLEDE